MMKNKIQNTLACLTAALLGISCAEMPERTDNDSNIHFLNKWVEVYNKKCIEEGKDTIAPYRRGIYILQDSPVQGKVEVTRDGYALVDYTVRKLDGTVTSTTDRDLALKVGLEVNRNDLFIPELISTSPKMMFAGLLDGLEGMTAGSGRTIMIPSWLMTMKEYATPEEYLEHKTDKPNTIYEMTVRDFAGDQTDFQNELMLDYVSEYDMTIRDTVEKGFFYKTLEALPETPEKEDGGKDDSTVDTTYIMINYTGKLLYRDYGSPERLVVTKIFDTSVERTAKDAGVFNPAAKYQPKKIVWHDDFKETTLDDSKVITGFSRTLWQMKEKKAKRGVGIFWSDLGYGRQGSGKTIPSYTPLVFEITRIVEEK